MKYKEQILKLRQQNKTYSEIANILKCARSVVCYHCGVGQKEKTYQRSLKYNQKIGYLHFINKKIYAFLGTGYQAKNNRELNKNKFYRKIASFTKTLKHKGGKMTEEVNTKSVLKKIGKTPKCYLTGRPINLNKSSTYQFDHIIPKSKGGTNDLANLGIACKEANIAKHNLYLDDFIKLCQDVLEHNGYQVIKTQENK